MTPRVLDKRKFRSRAGYSRENEGENIELWYGRVEITNNDKMVKEGDKGVIRELVLDGRRRKSVWT